MITFSFFASTPTMSIDSKSAIWICLEWTQISRASEKGRRILFRVQPTNHDQISLIFSRNTRCKLINACHKEHCIREPLEVQNVRLDLDQITWSLLFVLLSTNMMSSTIGNFYISWNTAIHFQPWLWRPLIYLRFLCPCFSFIF